MQDVNSLEYQIVVTFMPALRRLQRWWRRTVLERRTFANCAVLMHALVASRAEVCLSEELLLLIQQYAVS